MKILLLMTMDVKTITTKISTSVGVMNRLHCYFPVDIMLKLYYSLVYFHLTYALLAWGRSGRILMMLRLSVLTGEHTNYSQII